ncbi:hypothetical protein [Vibrio fluvialis]|uniref:hypothetical protein n=1 Tax=Vibrio fluvialis TaxID=676 RepID=UPI0023809142|nr:hypothetical protein [Vibrio fluvialis]WDY53799.1 hypothetical protein PUN47_07135 [Vibrio fluvialis]
MYVPSSFLYEIIQSEQTGIFCESNSSGDHAILVKLPTSVLKSLIHGAKSYIHVYLTLDAPEYIALVFEVKDNTTSPFHAVIPQRWISEFNRFTSSYFDKVIELTIYDETDAPVTSADIKIKTNFKHKGLMRILSNDVLLPAIDFDSTMMFLDTVCHEIGDRSFKRHKMSLQHFKFNVEITNVTNLNAIHVNPNSSVSYNVETAIDGNRQELQIFQALSVLIGSSSYHSPYVTIGKTDRELTDLLCITSNNCSIAIESKALTMDESSVNVSYEKNISKTIKHCAKALRQIEGAYKSIRDSNRIFIRESNETIVVNPNNKFFGIVLLDEYRNSHLWSDIFDSVVKLHERHGVIINILSVSELMYIIKLCDSDSSNILTLLEKRFEKTMDLKTFTIRLIDESLPII